MSLTPSALPALLGERDTYDEALADVKSAIAFHVETFGLDAVAPTV